jgi:hypothetical protein
MDDLVVPVVVLRGTALQHSPGVNGMVVVLHSTCDHYTYQLDGPEAIFLGEGDLHDTSYDYMRLIQSSVHAT